ncbi:MAG: DUF58 domain-containing protein [Clostridiaceae bacterium]|nr:DUF58 domain-containing protein [Clostridiaceae bacterium]
MTRNRILYLCLLLLSFSFVYFYGGQVPYMLFFTTLLLAFLSLVYTIIIYLRFKYHQEIDKKYIVKGDTIKFSFIISNEDFLFYPYISIKFFGTETIFSEQFKTRTLSLMPFSERVYSFTLSCKYCGNYEIGVSRIEIEDFLGLFRLVYEVPFPLSINVYPRIIMIDRLRLKMDFFSESYYVLDSKYEDIGALQDIRKYTYGDSLKKIHWKLTAKLNELMIRKFQSASEASVIIALDLKKNNFSSEQNTIIEDKLIESAVAINYYCLYSWIPVKLVYYTKEIVTINASSPFDFQNIYNRLAEIRFASEFSISETLDVYIRNSAVKTNLLILTSNLSYDLYDVVYYANFSGFHSVVVYVSPSEFTGGENEQAESIMSAIPRIGAHIYKINASDDIKPVLEG